jgi:hypothetical protein
MHNTLFFVFLSSDIPRKLFWEEGGVGVMQGIFLAGGSTNSVEDRGQREQVVAP